MALTNPKIPYKTIRDSLHDLFNDNKAVLNVDLVVKNFTEDNQIKNGNPEHVPTHVTAYPVIFVKIVDRGEQFRSIGNSGRKIPIVKFRLYGISRDMSTNREDEIINLTSNMEGLLRDNIQFDSNILWCDPVFTGWGLGEFEPKQYVDVVAIDLECAVEIK